jgi:hypothetical protein
MPRLQPNILLLTGVRGGGSRLLVFVAPKEAPQLLAAPLSVSYDRETTRLTAVVNLLNSSDHPIVASITNNVFVDSQKQPLTDRQEPWRIELDRSSRIL